MNINVNIYELLDNQHNELSTRVKNQTFEDSSWTLYSTLPHQLAIYEIAPCKESPCFPLPKKLNIK